MMSAKHILNTNTTALSFDDALYDFFITEEGYKLKIRDDFDFPENFVLKVNIHEIYREKEIDNMRRNEYVQGFVIHNNEEDTDTRFDEKSNNPIYFADHLFDIIVEKRSKRKYDEDGWISIPLETLDVEEDIFFLQFTNAEITKPLKDLKSMIEKGKEIDDVTNISALIERIRLLMNQGGVFTETVHIEIITRNLIRDRNNPTQLPDYSKKEIDPMFISIHNSIMTSNSVITGFTFERLSQQFRDPNTFRKNGDSPYDRLFMSK